LIRNQPAHGRLARAHEADEREVDGSPVDVHRNELAEIAGQRTPIFPALDNPRL